MRDAGPRHPPELNPTLESELGVRLFARTTRNFELTVAGKALMGEGSDLLA